VSSLRLDAAVNRRSRARHSCSAWVPDTQAPIWPCASVVGRCARRSQVGPSRYTDLV